MTELPLEGLLGGDVALDRRGADQPPLLVPHWRQRERDLDSLAVFANPSRLVVCNLLPEPDAGQQLVFLGVQLLRDKTENGLADHLLPGVAEDALGSAIP